MSNTPPEQSPEQGIVPRSEGAAIAGRLPLADLANYLQVGGAIVWLASILWLAIGGLHGVLFGVGVGVALALTFVLIMIRTYVVLNRPPEIVGGLLPNQTPESGQRKRIAAQSATASEIEGLKDHVKTLTDERDRLRAKVSGQEKTIREKADRILALEREKTSATVLIRSRETSIGNLIREKQALQTEFDALTDEHNRLIERLNGKEQELISLRDELARWQRPQVDIIHNKDDSRYLRIYKHLDKRRIEIYIGVVSHIAINDLTVEIESEVVGNEPRHSVSLREEGDAEPYKRVFSLEPEQEKLFYLASCIDPTGPFEFNTDEPPPRTYKGSFIIVVRGSGTLPLKRYAYFTFPGGMRGFFSFTLGN